MEASRLVFVSLKGAKPRRKVAVPVPDSYTYEQFADKVKLKLKLLSVGSIYHASTGDKLTSIDELQDIDELLVEEAPAQAPLTASAYADGQGNSVGESTEIHIGAPDRASSSMGAASAAMLRGSQPSRVVGGVENGGDDDEDVQKKYKKRNTGFMRRLQTMFPSMLQPGLPVTTRDVAGGASRKRRGGVVDPRTYLIIFAVLTCVATLILLYSRLAV
mmetsp:Transcript_34634/g.88614  ORF Transcript_34634/g.88614 Transcript_34634/m.88614 type:complete len:217 (+) Transcript_34634:163-813(+)